MQPDADPLSSNHDGKPCLQLKHCNHRRCRQHHHRCTECDNGRPMPAGRRSARSHLLQWSRGRRWVSSLPSPLVQPCRFCSDAEHHATTRGTRDHLCADERRRCHRLPSHTTDPNGLGAAIPHHHQHHHAALNFSLGSFFGGRSTPHHCRLATEHHRSRHSRWQRRACSADHWPSDQLPRGLRNDAWSLADWFD